MSMYTILICLYLQMTAMVSLLTAEITALNQNQHLRTTYTVIVENQRFYQLDFGINPTPMKRKRLEIMSLWLLSLTQDHPTDSRFFTHPSISSN
jgi:hypothetical protein